MAPVLHVSSMDTIEGMAPTLDSYNRIPSLSDTKRIISKAANYTCLVEESGSVYIATAAADFTLPAPSTANAGWNAWFFNKGDANMGIVSGTADKMVYDNDAAADKITASTSGHKIGAAAFVVLSATETYVFCAGNASAVFTASS